MTELTNLLVPDQFFDALDADKDFAWLVGDCKKPTSARRWFGRKQRQTKKHSNPQPTCRFSTRIDYILLRGRDEPKSEQHSFPSSASIASSTISTPTTTLESETAITTPPHTDIANFALRNYRVRAVPLTVTDHALVLVDLVRADPPE